MKRTEIAMIVLIASLSMMLTFTLVQALLGDTIKQTASVEKATAISQDITSPSKRIFNDRAINPTVEVCVEASNEDEQNEGATCDERIISDEQEQASGDQGSQQN